MVGIAAGLAMLLVGPAAHAVVGGAADATEAVVRIQGPGEPCSGTLVTERIVVTAAHCVQDVAPAALTVQVGAGAPWTAELAVDAIWVARTYVMPGPDGGVDVALLRLTSVAPVAPIDLGPSRPELGAAARVVGFGRSVPGDAASAGARRSVAVTIGGRRGDHVDYGAAGATSCLGDSGGALLQAGALVGVVSYGPSACDGAASAARLDGVAAQLAAVMAAWDGACAGGGCPACGVEGTCAAACVEVDLDCPLGAPLGAACAAATTCESRRCEVAPDDDDTRYCTRGCLDASDCVAPLAACAAGRCVYAGGTPGLPGAACAAAADCRSGLCDRGAGVCATPCGADDACPDGLTCAPVGAGRACTIAPGCGCGSAGGSSTALFAAALLGLGRRRRQPALAAVAGRSSCRR